jgi:DNA polymerase-3 subunit epsilon/CBS domain-containing protein
MEEMVAKQVSSVFVADDPRSGQQVDQYGILTERDVLRAVAAGGGAALDRSAGELASRPLHSIRAGAFAYRAIARMGRLRLRHLAVRDDEAVLVGAISARDLLRLRRGPALALEDAIEMAAAPADLAAAWATLPAVAGGLIAEDLPAQTVSRIVSEEIRAMTRRAGELALAEMRDAGMGDAPAAYALMVLGSGGRGESLLAPDQDNALVFDVPGEAGAPGGAADRWFEAFAGRVAEILDRAGIPLCKGGVMARNAQWRGSMQVWRQRIADWVARSRPEDLLNVDIFFDAVPVGGDVRLGNRLIAEAFELAKGNAGFSKLLAETIATGDAFNLFGGLRLEDGRIDLKSHGLFPIVALARTLALRRGLPLQSTLARLSAGADAGNADLIALAEAHPVFQKALLRQQSEDITRGIAPSNRLDPSILDAEHLRAVKRGLRAVKAVPDLVRDLLF